VFRRFIQITLIFILCVLLIELVTRSFFAWRVGPSVFKYGTPFYRPATTNSNRVGASDQIRTVQMHEKELAGYSKYQSREVRYDVDRETGERYQVTINNLGFRGRDIQVEKRPNVIRVVTLGASSTFGYYSRDAYTYPVQLEGMLNKSGVQEFEVINLGIPHLTATEIGALFEAEALPLQPDVVTFYEGNNDSAKLWEFLRGEPQKSTLKSVTEFFGRYLVSVGLVNSTLAESDKGPQHVESELETAATRVSKHFLDALENISAECERRGILFIVSNQQKRSDIFEREKFAGVTMQDELDLIKIKIAKSQPLSRNEHRFFVQMILMDDLENWATSAGLPFADAISALDQERDNILTHVHLSKRGNEVVAQQLSKTILENLNSAGNSEL
jgi:hypothetical protein